MVTHLTIVLPGRGYGAEGPALRFPRLALEELGAGTVIVEYPAERELMNGRESLAVLHRSVSTQVETFVAEAQPAAVTFLAKSLGTIGLATLDDPRNLAGNVDAIWITPIFGQEPVWSGAIRQGLRSLLVAGEADPLHEPERYEQVRRALGADSLLLRGADHSLEVPGDVLATIDGLRSLVLAVRAFAASDRAANRTTAAGDP
ncbi:MAG TPA: hypothetical protein VEH29_04015 [Acidimicrobiales bacterium]|nr:hypothetical protein [Acidimicrobiales bacterium]